MSRRKRSEGPRPPAPRPPRARAPALTVLHPNAAGIDVHADMHMVCVPAQSIPPSAPGAAAGMPAHVRRFEANSCDLVAIADWLAECGVTTVAMESTGVYWIPLFELLEARGLEVWLVEPGQLSRCGARPKTDVLDAQWIQRLHAYGLLQPSFRPPDSVLALRAYHRQRQMQIRYAAGHTQHMQKALEQMNVKLAEVVSDVTGVTGLAIIRAILAGRRDPLQLAKLRHDQCRRTEAEIARALYGNWREEHLFALRQALELYETYLAKLHACDDCIQRHLQTFADQSGGQDLDQKPRRRSRPRHEPAFDVRAALFRCSGVDLTLIEGIDRSTALTVLGEIGRDMSKWPTVKHFVSWLGLCPQHQGSGGKIKSRRTRRGANPAARALRLAAWCLLRSKGALGAYLRRQRSRLGAPKAVTAAAHQLGRIVYRLVRYGAAYVKETEEAYAEQVRQRLERQLRRRARELGFELRPIEASASPAVEG
jgi:transposase